MTDAQLLDDLAAYCHIDYRDDAINAELMQLYGSATDYLAGAGIDQVSDRYRLVVYAMVLEWYEGGQIGTVTVGLRQLINQLKLESLSEF